MFFMITGYFYRVSETGKAYSEQYGLNMEDLTNLPWIWLKMPYVPEHCKVPNIEYTRVPI